LEWVGTLGDVPLRWDEEATRELLNVLERGTVRSWRFLELSGVLERALPELAESLRRKRTDPFELDPTRAMRWELLEGLRDLCAGDERAAAEYAALAKPDRLLLAALVIDATADEELSTAVSTARRLVHRFGLGAADEEDIAFLVGERGLLRA